MPKIQSKKLSAAFLSFEKLEGRPAIERLCRIAVIAMIVASFALDLIVVMGFSRPYELAQFSQDEYWFLEEVIHLQNILLSFDWQGLRSFGSPFAYGFPFWLCGAIIALPLHGHVMLMALFLRLLSVGLKYAAFYVVYRRVLDLTHKPLFSALVLALLLMVPAFVFDGKIIGPEFFILFLVAVGWNALFDTAPRRQIFAAFCFTLAATIKINMAPLVLLFVAILWRRPKRDRTKLFTYWILGGIVPLLLFLFPAEPFKEIMAIGATHHVDYGLSYLVPWYGYDALEFDDMLKGGWAIDFIAWPFFIVFVGYAIFRDLKVRHGQSKMWAAHIMPMLVWTFYVALFACFLNSLNSLVHPWFVFAPFLLLVTAGCLFIGAGREGTAIMLAFFLIYAAWFGGRFVMRWDHRIDKFETVAASEPANIVVADWIVENCPKAREGAIDYNLLWPPSFNGHLKKMWTLIEIEDVRRQAGDAEGLLDNVDLLLLKAARVDALIPPTGPAQVTGSILGNFFNNGPPYYGRVKTFPHLTIFAREGVCKKVQQ